MLKQISPLLRMSDLTASPPPNFFPNGGGRSNDMLRPPVRDLKTFSNHICRN